MTSSTPLHLQYGVNAFAENVYKDYQPMRSTAHYPDPFCSDLRRALAGYTGLNEDMILVASGSDELIDIYIRLHKTRIPNLKVAFSPPTYPQYEAYTSREHVERILLPHKRATITADLVKQMGGDPATTVIMLDSPANPSGEIISTEQFLGLLDAGYQVFVDEAYYEFFGQTMAGYINKYPDQLVVSRSLSKFAAMAGSRIGYMLASPEVVADFRAQQLFFNVNSEGQHRALYALQHIDDFHTAIKEMRQTKQKVDTAIRALDIYDVYPSLDMYSIFKHRNLSTEQLHKELQEKHSIHVTRFPEFKGHDVIRSAVLQMPHMNRLITALAEYI
jgi:histidinol-phosphate aminotransferase